jgi:molybdopterin/thiamine biosynthesis adenylyltransferase/rhodanese-related sulfurtransferase
MTSKTWTTEETLQYQRHFILKDFGQEGQAKLKEASVLVVGAGGLGCPMLQYLAAAGVGTIGLVDGDVVSASNLHRQILFGWSDVGKSKVEVAKAKMADINPHIKINTHSYYVDESNIADLFTQYDIIADGSDNFKTRYLVNDACEILKKPLVFGAIYQFDGQLSVFHYNDGPSYRDLFPMPPEPGSVPNCAEAGVLGVLPGIVGSLQAAEVIKIITGVGEVTSSKLLAFDLRTMRTTILGFAKDPSRAPIKELIPIDETCVLKSEVPFIDVFDFEENLENGVLQILDIREDWERDISNLEGIWIPTDSISNVDLSKLDLKKKTVLLCKSGIRAEKWHSEYENLGFTDLCVLKGGLLSFIKETGADLELY